VLIGSMQVEIYIPGATSLKDKRRIVKGMITKVQNRFNVSIVEIDSDDRWQRATLGIAMVGDDREHVERQLQFVQNFLDSEPRWEVIRIDMAWN
jgi:uncharacterized protein YlxP (DUF503 family)